MEFKGTKTDWKRDGNLIFADDHFQTHIAVLPETFSEEKREANAKLIAAAPHLLEALIELKDQVVNDCSVGSDPKYKELLNVIFKTCDAIKKATE